MDGTPLVTGSSGLVGSETAEHLDAGGWTVHGLDKNMCVRTDYPEWSATVSVDAIFDDFVQTSSPAAS